MLTDDEKLEEIRRLLNLRIAFIREYRDTPIWHVRRLWQLDHIITDMQRDTEQLWNEWFPHKPV